MRRPDAQTLFLWTVLGAGALALGYLSLFHQSGHAGNQGVRGASRNSPVQGRRAFGYLEAVCDLGPRYSGSEGMRRQQTMLIRHFEQFGARVRKQTFTVRHPLDGSPVEMSNLIVEFHPDRARRVMLCAHYDTRPFPDRDPRRPRGRFIGANDGGSGVAVLMELAHHLRGLDRGLGVDIVLFDGEELVFDDRQGTYFWGPSISRGTTRRIRLRTVTPRPCCSTWSATPNCSFIKNATASVGPTVGRSSKRFGGPRSGWV